MSGASASTGPGNFTVISGRLTDGGGGYALPINCSVAFHRPGEINPATGIADSATFTRLFTIDAFPQSFTVMSDDIGGIVSMGDPGYVSSECDVDGNNLFDDNAGGFFPSLPLSEVAIPASSIDINIGPLP